ncbi:AAA family ATPase [Aquabacterium sp.]|uniref:AAA family ATPase n=1 Tax=Aquabacterium sp. TaxID=1872578 RepID=UPI002CA71BDF|nr:AAA family ATPase [Aquabacterium sp.]HSW07350.1 AAA family ATPase [Aquabacterium sp.]
MPTRRAPRPFILVLAGVNGAGKSSVGGALLAEQGLGWFDPDALARELITTLGLPAAEANARAWALGRDRLEAAIAGGENHVFETTLGGRTIPDLLERAARSHDLVLLFCGLASVEQHLQRVRLRVAHGGHDIPEARIRERWMSSRANLVRLLPQLSRLQVFDNSAEAAPGEDIPDPVLVLDMDRGRVVFPKPGDARALAATPAWARPIVQAALELQPPA